MLIVIITGDGRDSPGQLVVTGRAEAVQTVGQQ